MTTQPYIVTGYRTAVGKADKGGFASTRPDDLAVEVIQYLLKQVPDLDPQRIDDVIIGNAVPEAEQGMQMARWIALMAISKDIPGVTINRYCASGLEAIAMAHGKIGMGMADCILAGGTESMSLVPTRGWKTSPNYKLAKNYADYFLSMGLTGEEVAKDYEISREDQDEFGLRSHRRAVKAIEEGYFKEQIVPVEVEENYVEDGESKRRTHVVDTDEGPRSDTSLEVMAKLPPSFKKNGTVTPGNASQRSDGAAIALIMSEEMVKEHNLEPAARLVGCAVAGVNPRIMGVGPTAAVPKVLEQTGLSLDDIDLIELNEAFAAQSLAVIRELEMDMEKVNVNGGAIALGHPLGCTGCKLTVQMIHELRRRNKKYGMITACVGGGQGIAGVIELLN